MKEQTPKAAEKEKWTFNINQHTASTCIDATKITPKNEQNLKKKKNM